MDQADPVVEVAIAVRAGDDAVDPLVRRHRNQGGFRRSDTCLPGTRNQAVLGGGTPAENGAKIQNSCT